ncbi:kinetochore-associated Ndc80 complex subunit spc25 [Actinomortierella ambigua]|uniref:Kinetochore protein SPC25 n=1 Tax=Actinomortierella ambigua TaxID=1343610 RepID=A0A9P6PVW1_9FUNG|nr:kinetochore-associated Ndc80 complex subunit spc25 [Actinomortierella ambigua]
MAARLSSFSGADARFSDAFMGRSSYGVGTNGAADRTATSTRLSATGPMTAPLAPLALPSRPLPVLDYDFEGFLERIQDAELELDAKINAIKQHTLEQKHSNEVQTSRYHEEEQALRQELQITQAKQAELATTLKKERDEKEKVLQSVHELSSRVEDMKQRKADLEAELATLQQDVNARREAAHSHQRALKEQIAKNKPELEAFERYWAMRIVGVKEDHIAFVFTRVDALDWNKEFTITLDASQHDYDVVECIPDVPHLDQALAQLNRSRALGQFLKDVRQMFLEYTQRTASSSS